MASGCAGEKERTGIAAIDSLGGNRTPVPGWRRTKGSRTAPLKPKGAAPRVVVGVNVCAIRPVHSWRKQSRIQGLDSLTATYFSQTSAAHRQRLFAFFAGRAGIHRDRRPL